MYIYFDFFFDCLFVCFCLNYFFFIYIIIVAVLCNFAGDQSALLLISIELIVMLLLYIIIIIPIRTGCVGNVLLARAPRIEECGLCGQRAVGTSPPD